MLLQFKRYENYRTVLYTLSNFFYVALYLKHTLESNLSQTHYVRY